MRKVLSLILALMMCLPLCACGVSDKVSDEVKNAIIAECDATVAELMEDYYLNYFNDVESISYEINQIVKQKDDYHEYLYLVDITWYINATAKMSDYPVTPKSLIGYVMYELQLAEITVDGNEIKISHTKINEDDSVRIIANGSAPYSGYDYHLKKTGSSGNSTSSEDSFGHDKFDAFVIAEKTVKAQLKSPSTAKFCKTTEATISCSGNTWTVSGWVDAQNSFGATLRNNFTVKFTFSSSDKYTVSSCNIN